MHHHQDKDTIKCLAIAGGGGRMSTGGSDWYIKFKLYNSCEAYLLLHMYFAVSLGLHLFTLNKDFSLFKLKDLKYQSFFPVA